MGGTGQTGKTPVGDRPPAPHYVLDRPTDLRRAKAWHRYAYHINTLPARLEEMARGLSVPLPGRVLDYGCADVPYRHLFRDDVDFVAADLPGNPHATLELNSDSTVPEVDDSFDVVLSTQVLEHVTDPQGYLAECFRVLRPGGQMLLSTHGMFIYHPDPADYWRWTCEGLQRIVREAGFEIDRFEGIVGLAATGLQLVQDSVHHRLPTRIGQVLALLIQKMMDLADRLQSDQSRRLNASIFALVARKPSG